MSQKIYSIIQARGGSKGVPGKNIKFLGGYPVIAYSIAASKLSKRISRNIVSTNSPEISEIAKKYGAEVPFIRPEEFAQDNSTDLDVFTHAIKWLEENEGDLPDLLVQLRPATPLRDPIMMDSAIEKLGADPRATSLRSAHKLAEPPQKMFKIGEGGYWTGFFPDDPRPEYYNLPRQSFPTAFHPNGYVDIVRPDFIKQNPGLFYGQKSLAFETPFTIEIDTPEDVEYLEYIFTKKQDNSVYDYLKANFKKEN
ncbi:MAG TPA: acylneuraminate cytidylyltransferase family protein [Candidatus Paceibacterota bacterium]|nr:MAG: hypothetical protein A3J72_07550 [Nitrospirae bacterium RIFCSPHIGHO2_02_FULL_40_19]